MTSTPSHGQARVSLIFALLGLAHASINLAQYVLSGLTIMPLARSRKVPYVTPASWHTVLLVLLCDAVSGPRIKAFRQPEASLNAP